LRAVWRGSIAHDFAMGDGGNAEVSVALPRRAPNNAVLEMPNSPRRQRLFIAAVFLAVACASLLTVWLSHVSVQDAARIKFESTADDALNRIESSLNLDLSLLTSTRAFFRLKGADMSRVQFRQFFEALDTDRNFPGLRGIGYITMVRTGQEEEATRDIVKAQGVERGIYPDTDQEWRAPVILFEPLQDDNLAPIGRDMFVDPVRRSAIQEALESGEKRASARLQLGQATGNDRSYPGFLVFSPLADATSGGPAKNFTPVGLVYAAFRAETLFNTALGKSPLLPVSVEIYDGSINPDHLMFRSEVKPDDSLGDALAVIRESKVEGRTWYMVFRPTSLFTPPTSDLGTILIGLGGLLLAAAIAAVVRLQGQAVEAETALRMGSEKALLERELILQEMKHRIKNSIARILAMARQTGANARSIEEFTSTFAARLQAMSASQDMLTRSKWQRADLAELLRTELRQVFGQEIEGVRLSGPPVELNENATQALGLTFHELATNALKYGDAANGRGMLSVEWRMAGSGSKGGLVLTWTEASQSGVAKPSKAGFGTTLIDLNIIRELGGTIERKFGPEGLSIRIEIPLRQ
jgi:CHASE1-domain containing sensor protein